MEYSPPGWVRVTRGPIEKGTVVGGAAAVVVVVASDVVGGTVEVVVACGRLVVVGDEEWGAGGWLHAVVRQARPRSRVASLMPFRTLLPHFLPLDVSRNVTGGSKV